VVIPLPVDERDPDLTLGVDAVSRTFAVRY